jgi:hypothetical protein
LKTERWGSPLFQEKYGEKWPVATDNNNSKNNNITITITIIIIIMYCDRPIKPLLKYVFEKLGKNDIPNS